MNQANFLNAKISTQLGIIILLIIAILAIGISSINYGKTLEESIILEAYYPFTLKRTAKILPTKNIISIKAEDEILHYQKNSFWKEEDFSKFFKLGEKFEEREIQYFLDNLSKEEAEKIKISNSKIEFNEGNNSIKFSSDIEGVFSQGVYEFHWLFGNTKDFNFDNFKASNKELTFQGEINIIPTDISITFPFYISYSSELVWEK